MRRLTLAAAALPLLAACNRYELFVVEGPETAAGHRADVLFIIDNSDSMVEESRALAENFGAFAERLAGTTASYGHDGLPDAVDLYVDAAAEPGLFTDYQLAVTTTDALSERGELLGPILRRGDPNLAESFIETLMCEATCFSERSAVPSRPSFQCGDPFTGEVSQEFLDCTCGDGAWIGQCGGGAEQGLETAFLAMCRSVHDPPLECFGDGGLPDSQRLTNEGLLRPRSTLIPVVVTDEGDSSSRLPPSDSVPDVYNELFAKFERPMSWAVIGPDLDSNGEIVCPSLATSWGVARYDYLVAATGGLKVSIYGASCGATDFGDALDQLVALIGQGPAAFQLASEPVEGTVRVSVDSRRVKRADALGFDAYGVPQFSDGWSYRPADRTVLLHGEAKPEPGETVQVYYLPR